LAVCSADNAERDAPAGGDQVVSVQDPDARRGKPGACCTGSRRAGALDAASQISTALDVLPATGDAAADATALITHQETVHGHDVQTVSSAKAGLRGAWLREGQDPDGLALDVVVPPTTVEPPPYFTAADVQQAAHRGTVTGPGAVTTARRPRHRVDTGGKDVVPPPQCATWALQQRCLERLPQATARTVVINAAAAEEAAARQKAETPI
jgi:hypothetical protein